MPKIGMGGGGGGETSSVRAFEESQKNFMAGYSDVIAAPSVAAAAPGKVQNTATPTFPNTVQGNDSLMQGGLPTLDLSGVTFNIDAGLISSPATVGQDIIDAILAAQRDSGVVFQPASGL
jgi:hypothetical protein